MNTAMNFRGYHKMCGVYWLAEELLAFSEGCIPRGFVPAAFSFAVLVKSCIKSVGFNSLLKGTAMVFTFLDVGYSTVT